ncbi:hypothetical protein GKZ90_0022285 [Flavobacterium sp. MC2016-06]|jgi:hypothetical protein|uniref:hypothetical protein n=1 Tax=Flavobacterium sp. MC2016-06 TaxID=2676308 RepID=UPI0012BAD866|nr:hypothetical protein [Flavobacterium sp. MC2016-06]MBU3861269.1 hypothetical protein [Flavobacterium sp. MC2016-06]
MELLKTIIRGNKKSAVRIDAKVKYEIFGSFDDPSFLKENNVFKVDEGKVFFDLIGYQDPWNFAISERFKNILEKNNITGWDCYPIIIEDTDLKYFGFQITGKAGIISEYDEDGDRVYGSIKVDLETWDGSDIFCLGDTAIKVISSKLFELIKSSKITNVEFDDLNKY